MHNDHCKGRCLSTFSETPHQKSHIGWSDNDEMVGKHLTSVVKQSAL